jgi:nucleotide-binding universal stress UspA family protein
MSDSHAQTSPMTRRKFLAVVDETPECRVALHYAARRAQHTGGLVTLIFVIEPADFQQWGGIERKMAEEAREEAESALHAASKVVNDILGAMPELIIREGRTAEEIRAFIAEDRAVSILVLAAGTAKEGPGPLVSAVAGPTAGAFPIPVTIVPGSLTDEQIDALA